MGNSNIKTVNVYGCEERKIILLRITTIDVARQHVNLLYITAGETSHYVLVKNLSRLVSRQYNNHYHRKYQINFKFLFHISKSNLQKQNTNFVYLLLSTPISKAFCVNKARVRHRHRNTSPLNTSIMYHVGAASM